jgi:cytochrome oxidase Cu insertion factor (SCO1/SenC/PrrC family)
MAESDVPLGLTVHPMALPSVDDAVRRTRSGRFKMLLVLAVCGAPVVASYLTYFVIRPQARTNYSELVLPPVPVPAGLPLLDLHGAPVAAASLEGQWLLVVVAAARCDARCEKYLWLQRQLRETLGRDRDRLDKVWLIPDGEAVPVRTMEATGAGGPAMTVLRTPRAALSAWLQPAAGHAIEDHLYIVDPQGHWMMRTPVDPDPARLKRDLEKLLRASAGWDRPGR